MSISAESRTTEAKETEKTIVIVGGGPIGLAHAWAIKKLNSKLNVVVLEKYKEYQRNHTLIMQHSLLEALMTITNTLNDPNLAKLLARLKKDPHIKTTELEAQFKKLALENGATIQIEEVKDGTIHEQLARLKPSFIIGADGTHSVVNRCLYPKDNQVKIPFDYVLQLRFEIDGDHKADSINTVSFYQTMARYGMIANEYTGHYDAEKKKTPVTMQMMISQEAFNKLQSATSKKPILPFAPDGTSCKEEKKSEPDDETIEFKDVPVEIRGFLNKYLIQKLQTNKQKIDPKLIRISVNEAPATYAKEPFYMYGDIPVILVGDAGLGLSYFKGLNAGIESTNKFISMMMSAFMTGLTDIAQIKNILTDYTTWFINQFAPSKVKEVESYSTYQIRFPEKIVQHVRNIKDSSMEEDLMDESEILDAYFKIFGTNASTKPIDGFKNLYPHRPYDPNINLGQFDYIPLTYTLKKIAKLFTDYFKPYKSDFQLRQDFKQPLVGSMNLLSGMVKIIVGFFSLNFFRFLDGLFSATRGLIEITTTPLAWFIKPLTRGLATLIAGKPTIENNNGMKKVANIGLDLLNKNAGLTDEVLTTDPHIMYRLLAVTSDLHRKYNKCNHRGQSTDVTLDEAAAFTKARTSHTVADFKRYFSLFSEKQQTIVTTQREAADVSKVTLSSRA